MKKIYKACQVCDCEDCTKGTNRDASWYCPVFKKQICDVCCIYDLQDAVYAEIRAKCRKAKCIHFKEI